MGIYDMDDRILLTIQNETPLEADELGELFKAFARDYRDITRGRTLVIVGLAQGSTLIEWTDYALSHIKEAAEVLKAVKGIAEFAAALKSLCSGEKKPKKSVQLPSRRRKKSVGQRSAEAIASIAVEHQCNVRFRHTTAKGEVTEFEMSPGGANDFQSENAAEYASAARARTLETPEIAAQGQMAAIPDFATSINRLYQSRDGSVSHTEIDQIAETLVSILESSGLSHLLEQIASGFEMHGLSQVAWALRQKGQRNSGTHEPPLTTG